MLTNEECAWRADALEALASNPDANVARLAGQLIASLHTTAAMRGVLHSEALLTRAQVAQLLGVSVDTVTSIVDRGELAAAHVGDGSKRYLRITREAVHDYLASRAVTQRPRYEFGPRVSA